MWLRAVDDSTINIVICITTTTTTTTTITTTMYTVKASEKSIHPGKSKQCLNACHY